MNLFSIAYQRVHQPFHLQSLAIRIFALVLVSVFSFSCSNQKPENSTKNVSLPVTVSTVVQKTVPVQLRTIGNVQAYSTVSVKTKVGGEIIRVYFTEGQDVKKGALLFTIDPRPFESALKQAEANLERDMAQVKQANANLERDIAQVKNAEEEAKRYEYLIGKGVIAKEQYDRVRTSADVLEATVRADKAAVENAEATVNASRAAVENIKIQLGYCSIHSPMDGRTGSLLVQQGNIVKADDVNLVVINQIIPIYVAFSVPEQDLSEMKKFMAMRKLKVEAIIPNDQNNPAEGVITFIDNTVDSSTGTIRIKGTFANKENRLWPGQFVNVILTLTTQPNVAVIPSQAIQTGQQGQYVFVVKPDLTVESRPVVVGRTFNGETIIEKGLKIDEKVVTDGQLRLSPGVKVDIETSPPAPAPKDNS